MVKIFERCFPGVVYACRSRVRRSDGGDFAPIYGCISKTVEVRGKVLIRHQYRNSYLTFQLATTTMTFSDLERSF